MANKKTTAKTKKTIKGAAAPRGFVMVPKKAFNKLMSGFNAFDWKALNI